MSNSLVISIIINWNLINELQECLDSLLLNDYSPHKIIFVDNGSTDGSATFVSNHYPMIDIIALPTNGGYAKGLNTGLIKALQQNPKYIFTLNNDIVLKNNVISRLVETLETNLDIGIATPKILQYYHRNKLFGLGDRIYPLLPLPIGFGYGKLDKKNYQHILEFDYVTGCAMMIRSEIFFKIGFFDTSYFMYYEDADFCRRTRENGYKIVCVCDALIYHKGGQSTKQNNEHFVFIRARNRIRFFNQYPHGLHPLLTNITLLIIAIWRTIFYFYKGKRKLIIPYWRGLLEGWRESRCK